MDRIECIKQLKNINNKAGIEVIEHQALAFAITELEKEKGRKIMTFICGNKEYNFDLNKITQILKNTAEICLSEEVFKSLPEEFFYFQAQAIMFELEKKCAKEG